jgi:hypothetical protein
MKRTISRIILSSLIILSGCHSFYQIDTSELLEMSSKDVIQIEFENGETIKIDSIQHIKITKNQELEIIKYSSTTDKIDSVRTLYLLNEIKEIRVKKLNPQKTIFSSFWITIGVAFAIMLAFALTGNPITFGPG